jgi:hypothetical protein
MSVIIPKDSVAMKLIKKHRQNMNEIAKLMKPIIINYVQFEKECYEKHDSKNIDNSKFDYTDLDDIVHEMLNHDFYYAIQEIREDIENQNKMEKREDN